jgi:uncharacterized membrane protein YgcG
MRASTLVLRLILGVLWLSPLPVVTAAEAILDFQSDIRVLPDAAMTVEETIQVRAEGKEIRRGIYRDFPTDYTDRYGNRYQVGFEVLAVERDGRTENYRLERRANGVRVYIGKPDVFLQPGRYAYTIRYRTDRQLGYFERHDELYWNVTGNGWSFPIERASARVALPRSVPPGEVQGEGYTGEAGSKAGDLEVRRGVDGRLEFETTRPLRPGEGLTIVASWPKGHVAEPSASDRLGYFVDDNREALVGVVGLLLLVGYYGFAWLKVGRDPAPGVIVTRYDPPEGYAPAALRFVRRMGYDNKAFATALVNLAVHGHIDIEEDDKGAFTLTRRGSEQPQAPGERAVLDALFDRGGSITLEQANHRTIGAALKAHKGALARHLEKVYFLRNAVFLVPGILISLVVIGLTVLSVPSGEARGIAAFMSLWLSGWTVAVIMLARMVWAAWRPPVKIGPALYQTLFAVPFFAGEVFGIGMLATQGSPATVVVLLGVIAVNALFYHWLKAPTLRGRKLLDQVDGFRDYLQIAEKDDLAYRHPEEGTPRLFERFLPYALALDLEQAWAARFSAVLDGSAQSPDGYRPGWYRGNSLAHRNFGAMAGALGTSLNSAIASSSTAPGSSSGGGGGGSSGGGGGGGGGGGW